MNAILTKLRSMKFSLILMIPILVCSVIGSIVPQSETESYYMSLYPNGYHLVMGLGLDHIFAHPVFLTLAGLFALNLGFCSAWQTKTIAARRRALENKCLSAEEFTPLEPGEADKLDGLFRKSLYLAREEDGKRIYSSRIMDWCGSAVTHFAILGIILASAGIFLLSDSVDHPIMPGDNTLPDGSSVYLEDFTIRSPAGNIDYASTLSVTDNGRSSGMQEIRVNHPLRFLNKKYYQQSYGVSAEITTTVVETGESSALHMTEEGFITLDEVNGIWFANVYPGYIEDENGEITLITSTSGEYTDPVYYVISVEDGVTTPVLVFPGEEMTIGGIRFSFNEPIVYPGIRVKTTPIAVYVLLYLSFAAITVGLYLCFFRTAAVIVVRENGYHIVGKSSTASLEDRIRFTLHRKGTENHA